MSGIRRGALADEVVAYVRDQILGGEMKPGHKIDQDAVAGALGVSRSPIREALVVLGQEGLVTITPRRGAFVASISREDVIDHYELYGLVSGRVAAMAAANLSVDQVQELQSIHNRFAVAPVNEQSDLNNNFHELVNTVAPRRTRWLLRHLEKSIPATFFRITPGWKDKATVGHNEIVQAILDRDASAARAAMENHLHEAGVAAADALAERGFWEADE